jgi:hypothetical protein
MQINKEPDAPIAIATLKSDFYMNKDKTVGRTYFPIFEVLDFITIPEEGEEEPEVTDAPKRIAPAKVAAPAPAPRRARVVAPIVEELEDEAPTPRRTRATAPALFEPEDEETSYEEVLAEEAPAPRRRMRR